MSDPRVFLRLPDGEQIERPFEVLPRVGETIHFEDQTYRVSAVEFRLFPGQGTYFHPVLVLTDEAQ